MKIKIEVVFDTDIQKDLDALQEFGKLLIIIGVALGMYWYISWACKGCI